MEKRRKDEEEIPPMRILEPFRAEVIEFDDKNDFIGRYFIESCWRKR